LQFPISERDWERIAKGFEMKCNFPNCLGAVDGKHVVQFKKGLPEALQ
jgi:hypothetical protein